MNERRTSREHCVFFNMMEIDSGIFVRLLEFVGDVAS